jgi:hypothetical protein
MPVSGYGQTPQKTILGPGLERGLIINSASRLLSGDESR